MLFEYEYIVYSFNKYTYASINLFPDNCRKTFQKTGDMWQVLIDFLGGPQDQKRAILDLDRAKITFANLLKFKVKTGYSARDFMYYMKRCGNDTALLQRIDYEEDALAMIEDCIQEKKIRIAVSDTQLDQEGEYAITPIKQRSTHEEVSGQGIQDEDIDAYKVWLNKLPQDENNLGTNILEKYISMIFRYSSQTYTIYITSIYASCRI